MPSWRAEPSSPTVSSDGKVVYVGGNDFNLYAVNVADGTQLWNFTTGGAVESSAALSSDGKVVYVGTEGRNVDRTANSTQSMLA
jgi:outer membrane protein assembly factor BamB